MKKISLIGTALSALLLSSSSLFAQSTTMSGSDARIGIKAGVNLSTVKYSGFQLGNTLNDVTKQNVGYNFTVFGDFGVGNNFFIQPGISLQNKGTKFEGTFGNTTGEQTIKVMAIEVPVNAVLRIPAGQAGAFQLSAGPYVGFHVDGKRKTTITNGANQGTTEENLKFGNDANDDAASTDFGANFGLGYRMNNGFMLGANYGMGLTNIIPKENRTNNNNKATNRVWGFSIGYSF